MFETSENGEDRERIGKTPCVCVCGECVCVCVINLSSEDDTHKCAENPVKTNIILIFPSPPNRKENIEKTVNETTRCKQHTVFIGN